MPGREYHSHQYTTTSGSQEDEHDTRGAVSLKDPPTMHLRDDMVKRRVRTKDGIKTMECAMTWEQFQHKYGAHA